MSDDIETKEDLIEAVESLRGRTKEIEDLRETVEGLQEEAVTDVPDIPDDLLTVEDLHHWAHEDCETEACNQIRQEFGWMDEEGSREEVDEQEESESGESESDAESDEPGEDRDSGEDVDGGEAGGKSEPDEPDDPGPIFG